MKKSESNEGTTYMQCLNCHAELTNDFCAECGQSALVERYTFKSFAREVYYKFRSVDAVATLRTFRELTFTPGKFVSHYLEGKRVGYTGPIAYFFYFFVLEIFIRSALLRFTGNADLGNTSSDNLHMQIITLISTVFWGALWYLFYKKSPLNLIESIIAAIYFVAQVNIFSLVILLISAPLTVKYPQASLFSAFAELALDFFYGIFFCRRLFREPYWKLIPKQLGLTLLYIVVVLLVVVFDALGTAGVKAVTDVPAP